MGQVHIFFPPASVTICRSPPAKPDAAGLGAGPKIGQTLSLPRLLLPANDAPVFDQEERTAVRADTPCCWEDAITLRISSLVCAFSQVPLIGPTNPHSFFFRRIASSTDISAKARSLSWSSRLMAS